MASLTSLERYAVSPSRRERLLGALEPLLVLAPALLLLAGASAFVFGVRRTLLDTGLWWRLGLALAGVVGLRALTARRDALGLCARAVEALLFVAATWLAVRQALETLLGPAA